MALTHSRLRCGWLCSGKGYIRDRHNLRRRGAFSNQCLGWGLLGIRTGRPYRWDTFDHIATEWHATSPYTRQWKLRRLR